MNCADCHKKANNFIEKNISVDVQKQVEEHLQNCKPCALIYNKLQVVLDFIEKEKALKLNPFLTSRIMATIENSEIKTAKSPVFAYASQSLLIAASVAIALFIGVAAGNLYQTKPAQQVQQEEVAQFNDATLESMNLFLIE